jgi:hypothetical protein
VPSTPVLQVRDTGPVLCFYFASTFVLQTSEFLSGGGGIRTLDTPLEV